MSNVYYQRWKISLFIVGALCIFIKAQWVQAEGQGPDSSPALVKAYNNLVSFKSEVGTIKSLASKPLGPYKLHTKCTWCSEHAWWGLGLCTKNTTETWNSTVDFSWTRRQLTSVLSQAEGSVDRFKKSYAPTQAWLNSIPDLSREFTQLGSQLDKVRAELKQGNNPSPAEREAIMQALVGLNNKLETSQSQLKSGISALSASLQTQSQYRSRIKSAIKGADDSADKALTRARENASKHRCQGGLDKKFAGFRRSFSKSLNEIESGFAKLEKKSSSAEKSIADILGQIVSSQTQLKSISEVITSASADELGSFIEKLHFNAAQKMWEQLADAYNKS